MGSIADLIIPTEEVLVSEDITITLRGLSFLDLSVIIQDHAKILDKLYHDHIVKRQEMPPTDQLAKALMTEAPDVVAHIIAHANDEPESWEKVQKIAGIVQINCLVSVARLTFHSEAEVKKLMETVIQGAEVLSNLLGVVRNPSLQKT